MLKAIALVALALSLEGGFILHSVVSYAPAPAPRAVVAGVVAAPVLPPAPGTALHAAVAAAPR